MTNYNILMQFVEHMTDTFDSLFSLAAVAYTIFVLYRVFEKAGVPGWKAIVPGYNLWTLCEIVWGRGTKMFFFLIPIYGIIIYFKTCTRLALAFGKPTSFGVGLFFVSPVFLSLLAFTNVTYIGPQDIQ